MSGGFTARYTFIPFPDYDYGAYGGLGELLYRMRLAVALNNQQTYAPFSPRYHSGSPLGLGVPTTCGGLCFHPASTAGLPEVLHLCGHAQGPVMGRLQHPHMATVNVFSAPLVSVQGQQQQHHQQQSQQNQHQPQRCGGFIAPAATAAAGCMQCPMGIITGGDRGAGGGGGGGGASMGMGMGMMGGAGLGMGIGMGMGMGMGIGMGAAAGGGGGVRGGAGGGAGGATGTNAGEVPGCFVAYPNHHQHAVAGGSGGVPCGIHAFVPGGNCSCSGFVSCPSQTQHGGGGGGGPVCWRSC